MVVKVIDNVVLSLYQKVADWVQDTYQRNCYFLAYLCVHLACIALIVSLGYIMHSEGIAGLVSLDTIIPVLLLIGSLRLLHQYKSWSEQDKVQTPPEVLLGDFQLYIRLAMLCVVALINVHDIPFCVWAFMSASESYFSSCKPKPPMYKPSSKTVFQS